jgi:beta-glucosidase
VTKTSEESAVLVLEAGCDINCGCTYQSLLSAYREGILDENLVTRSCERAFTTRYLLGIMTGQHTEHDEIPLTAVDSVENRMLAKRAAEESAVLLRNKGGAAA